MKYCRNYVLQDNCQMEHSPTRPTTSFSVKDIKKKQYKIAIARFYTIFLILELTSSWRLLVVVVLEKQARLVLSS